MKGTLAGGGGSGELGGFLSSPLVTGVVFTCLDSLALAETLLLPSLPSVPWTDGESSVPCFNGVPASVP